MVLNIIEVHSEKDCYVYYFDLHIGEKINGILLKQFLALCTLPTAYNSATSEVGAVFTGVIKEDA